MRIDPLLWLNEAIEAAFEAAALPLLVALGVLIVVLVVSEVSSRVRARRSQRGSRRKSDVGTEPRRAAALASVSDADFGHRRVKEPHAHAA